MFYINKLLIKYVKNLTKVSLFIIRSFFSHDETNMIQYLSYVYII